MAYVRKRGNQVAIVQGERDRSTGKVEQRILFTLYSKAEAREAIGQGGEDGDARFRSLLQFQYPGITFSWKRIAREIQKSLDVLPEEYPYRESRLKEHFRRDLCAFTRLLIHTDPQSFNASADLIAEHRIELEYLRDLISWRLEMRKQEKSEWNRDDRFFWRYALQGWGIPPEAEETAESFYDKGDLPRAKVIFRLLTECFEDYAEGHNYLGLIALQEDDLEEAETHFRKTMELGRRLFPARIAKKWYWSDHKTRPYIRGLSNLALTLNRQGRHVEALELADRLESECGRTYKADAEKALAYLHLGRFEEASEAALRAESSQSGFIAGFALEEQGLSEEALVHLLHASINYPRSARMLAGFKGSARKIGSREEADDHNGGIELLQDLRDYFKKRPSGWNLLRRILKTERVEAILDEAENVVRRWNHQIRKGEREAFDRMHEMKKLEFARERAREIFPLLFPKAVQKGMSGRTADGLNLEEH